MIALAVTVAILPLGAALLMAAASFFVSETERMGEPQPTRAYMSRGAKQ